MAWTEIPVTKAGCRLFCSVFLWKKDKWWRIFMHISLLVKSVTEIVFTSGEGPGSQGGRDTYCSLYVISYCWPWVCITFPNMIRTLKSVSWSLTYISTGESLYSLKIVLVFKNLILCKHWPPVSEVYQLNFEKDAVRAERESQTLLSFIRYLEDF